MKTKDKAKSRPWRDNIEAVTVSIITIVLFKYFILEAYKIPTGSMQPTLMGDDGSGIYDRVLVDKLSFHFRDPERFEIVVFKYPLDRSKNFIKRIWGMPDEYVDIQNGDLLVRASEDEEWHALQRTRPIQRSTLKRLDTAGEWKVQGEGWVLDGSDLHGTGPGSASFPRTKNSVLDHYTDGYPGKMATKVRVRAQGDAANEVGDLRIEGEVRALAETTEVLIEFREGRRRYTMVLPGPAADAEARPEIRTKDLANEIEESSVRATEAWRLEAGERIRFAAQNLDDKLGLEIGGDVLLELVIPAASDQRSGIQLLCHGAGAEFEDLSVFRDIYFTSNFSKFTSWRIPEGHYLMLGDNTQDSSDGRDWQLTGYEVATEDGAEPVTVLGNRRPSENPRTRSGDPGGLQIFFYDERGERWVFRQADAELLEPIQASFVPRELIRGRAVVVVWPIAPSLDVYRLKWVR